jgi:hypothetical protein
MGCVAWNSIPVFYAEDLSISKSFTNQNAQQFFDYLASWAWWRVWVWLNEQQPDAGAWQAFSNELVSPPLTTLDSNTKCDLHSGS